MLKNEKEKFILSVIVTLVFIGFLIWQGIFVVNADIDNSINVLKDKKISKDVYALKGKSLEEEKKAFEYSKQKIEEINDHFVYASDNDDTEFTSFFGQLDDIAVKSTQKEESLVIDLVQNGSKAAVKSSAEKDTAGKADDKEDSRLFKLTLKSNYEGLLKFISYLEAMPYYVYIESVTININNGEGSDKNFDSNASASSSPGLQSILIIKVFKKTNIL